MFRVRFDVASSRARVRPGKKQKVKETEEYLELVHVIYFLVDRGALVSSRVCGPPKKKGGEEVFIVGAGGRRLLEPVFSSITTAIPT